MVNNQTSCVIVKVIADYNVIDYDYIASGNYDYWRSCNRLHSITISITITPKCYQPHKHFDINVALNVGEDFERQSQKLIDPIKPEIKFRLINLQNYYKWTPIKQQKVTKSSFTRSIDFY